MADSARPRKPEGPEGLKLELVGLPAGGERPDVVVQALGAKNEVLHAQKIGPEGRFAIPPDILKRTEQVAFGAPEGEGLAAGSAVQFRRTEFEAAIANGTLALAEGVWSRFRFLWQCVSGSVRVCRRRPIWFDALISAAVEPLAARTTFRAASVARASFSQSAISAALNPSIAEIIAWPVRCSPVCLGTVEVFRRTCCCWPILVLDDPRIPRLVRDLEIIVQKVPKGPFPPPPDPFITPFFKGGALNEMALNAPGDLSALRTLRGEAAVQYINSRVYLLRHICSCDRPVKVATGSLLPDGTFNICWIDRFRLPLVNCHDEYAYIVKQTIGGTTKTIYDGVAAGAWYHAGDHPVLTTYRPDAFSCNETGTGDGTAFVYLDQVDDINAYELNTPASTSWNSVAMPNTTSGLMFPNAAEAMDRHRNLGGNVELTFLFSQAMREPSVGAKYYRIGVTKADANGNPTGPPRYYGEGGGFNGSGDVLAWLRAVVTGTGVDTESVKLGPDTVGTEKYLYRIPYNKQSPSDTEGEDWTGNVRYHALIDTTDAGLNVPADVQAEFDTPASNHLITLEVFNAAGERLRPLGVPGSGQTGTEVARPFKFRRWFQPEGSPGDDTIEVPFAALTHLFCWDNRVPRAEITELVIGGTASDAECQFGVGDGDSEFAIKYRAYVPDNRFQRQHTIGWVRGLGGTVENGGKGSLGTTSPANVGEPLDPAEPSDPNTFELMLTRLNPPADPVVLERCAFAVTLTTEAKTIVNGSLSHPYATETAAFALEIDSEDEEDE
jgi:hypothetical protein